MLTFSQQWQISQDMLWRSTSNMVIVQLHILHVLHIWGSMSSTKVFRANCQWMEYKRILVREGWPTVTDRFSKLTGYTLETLPVSFSQKGNLSVVSLYSVTFNLKCVNWVTPHSACFDTFWVLCSALTQGLLCVNKFPGFHDQLSMNEIWKNIGKWTNMS